MMYKKGGLYGKKNNFCVINCWDLPICDCMFASGESFDIMNRVTDNDNPLSGKSTDERIIMSLKDTYPEHTFSAINSFDNDKEKDFF